MIEPRIGSLCSGYEGLGMAAMDVFGGELAWVADIDPGACKILAHRYPTVPNLGDIKTADWRQVEPVDIVLAGYPCQPFSDAGLRKGIEDERHLWPWIATALGVLRPRVAIFENVAGHLRRGFDTVLADLAGLGFDVEWTCVLAADAGATHPRRRLIIKAVAQDADRSAGREWRPAAPGQEEGGRSRADAGGRSGLLVRPAGPLNLLPMPADMGRNSRSLNEFAVNMLADVRPDDGRWVALNGVDYGPTIRLWETVLGRPAPCPTEPGARGNRRLSCLFTEWMQGVPEGHVTAVPDITRKEILHALGNGVCPQQVAYGLRLLSARNAAAVAA